MISFLNPKALLFKPIVSEQVPEPRFQSVQFSAALDAFWKQVNEQSSDEVFAVEPRSADLEIVEESNSDAPISSNLLGARPFTPLLFERPLHSVGNDFVTIDVGFQVQFKNALNFPLERYHQPHEQKFEKSDDELSLDHVIKTRTQLISSDQKIDRIFDAKSTLVEKSTDQPVKASQLPAALGSHQPQAILATPIAIELMPQFIKGAVQADLPLTSFHIVAMQHTPQGKDGGHVKSLTLQLLPKELGQISLSLTRAAHELVVRIAADREDTASLFMRDQSLIQTILREAISLPDNVPVRVILNDANATLATPTLQQGNSPDANLNFSFAQRQTTEGWNEHENHRQFEGQDLLKATSSNEGIEPTQILQNSASSDQRKVIL